MWLKKLTGMKESFLLTPTVESATQVSLRDMFKITDYNESWTDIPAFHKYLACEHSVRLSTSYGLAHWRQRFQ